MRTRRRAQYQALLIALSLVAAPHADGAGLDASARYDVSANRCGPLALRLCARFVDAEVSGDAVDRAVVCGDEGCSMLALAEAAESAGLQTLAVRWAEGSPTTISTPAVIPIRRNDGRAHFVAMLSARDGRVLICDLGTILRWVEIERLRSDMHWDGHALHVAARASDLDGLRLQIRGGRLGPARSLFIVPSAAAALLTSVLLALCVGRRSKRHSPIG